MPSCPEDHVTFCGAGNRDLNIKLNTSLGPAGPGLRVSRIHHWHGTGIMIVTAAGSPAGPGVGMPVAAGG